MFSVGLQGAIIREGGPAIARANETLRECVVLGVDHASVKKGFPFPFAGWPIVKIKLNNGPTRKAAVLDLLSLLYPRRFHSDGRVE